MNSFKKYMKADKNQENTLNNKFKLNVSINYNISLLEELFEEYNSFEEHTNYNEIVSQFMEVTKRSIKILNEKIQKLENN